LISFVLATQSVRKRPSLCRRPSRCTRVGTCCLTIVTKCSRVFTGSRSLIVIQRPYQTSFITVFRRSSSSLSKRRTYHLDHRPYSDARSLTKRCSQPLAVPKRRNQFMKIPSLQSTLALASGG
jgi:hypothetical protein